MQTETLIHSLTAQTQQNINQAEAFKTRDQSDLSWRADNSSWNIQECLEHLNLYGDYYLPRIEHNIKNSKTHPESEFRSSLLGGYFAKSMLPKEKLNKMSTFADKNPLNTLLDRSVIDRFIDQQFKILDLIQESRNVSLNRIKIETSISSLIRIRLGDTFGFLINHIVRHLHQIEKIDKTRKGL